MPVFNITINFYNLVLFIVLVKKNTFKGPVQSNFSRQKLPFLQWNWKRGVRLFSSDSFILRPDKSCLAEVFISPVPLISIQLRIPFVRPM